MADGFLGLHTTKEQRGKLKGERGKGKGENKAISYRHQP